MFAKLIGGEYEPTPFLTQCLNPSDVSGIGWKLFTQGDDLFQIRELMNGKGIQRLSQGRWQIVIQ